MRMRKQPNLIPRMERCAETQIKKPAEYKGRWRSVMNTGKVYLELGCGKGAFTCETAKTIPDILLVAVERVPDAMVIGMERAMRDGIKNVRFIDMDVAAAPDVFEKGEVDRIYINFCDPWPRKRHAKRRLTSPGFLKIYREILRPGGEIHFKTDNLPLFEYSLDSFRECGFELAEITNNLHENGICGVMTDYEKKFHEMGTKINRCVARPAAE